jgi:hypothetical protein
MTSATKPKPSPATIKQINAAHDAVVGSGREGLQNAIRAGELLSSVKQGTEHGDWETWLSANCPDISPRTARLYMRLANNDDKLTAKAEQNGNTVADLSVRGAMKLLSEPLTEEAKAARQRKQEANKRQKLQDNLGALAPEEIMKLLIAGWPDNNKNFGELAKLLNDHLGKKPPPSEQQQSNVGAFRRSVGTEQHTVRTS